MPLLARTHPRLSAAATLGIAVGILAPPISITSKVLISWNTGVWTWFSINIVAGLFGRWLRSVKR